MWSRVKLVNKATATCVPAMRCSTMPIDEASIAQAWKPWSTKPLKPACSVTGSGVVRPVDWMVAPGAAAADGGSPTPSVPTTPQRLPSSESACATHHAVEVLPLVPVTATTSSRLLGCSYQALASGPVAALRPASAPTFAPSKWKASAPLASTRHAAAPAARAAGTNWRPSFA